MNKVFLIIVVFFHISFLHAQDNWIAKWITTPECQDEINSWFCLRKDFVLEELPDKALAKIAVDSKYWLWVNGTMVVFEGGLKRGPNPKDTYYDTVDISAYLNKGSNNISVLGWYFGKHGYSHISSGKFGFLFECVTPQITLLSDASWKVIQNQAYETCPPPLPNHRLPESSIRYNATKDPGIWYANEYSTKHWRNAIELGKPPMYPWNNLILRPIPQWRDSKLVSYVQSPDFPFQIDRDTTITLKLPANLQITPYLEIETNQEGKVIEIRTDNFIGGGAHNIYAQYVSTKGVQAYESYGWMNGHEVIYKIPAGVKLLDLKYRETGYDSYFAGSFTSSDDFLNTIWQKAQRTLYVTMRDNYMDCPDRERAQWWGDLVIQAGQSFYALDKNSHLLIKKGMYELMNWQRSDSTLFSPIPAGNWGKELPVQMLTSIGYYGFWNYYINTGDIQTLSDLYDGLKKYLKVWKFNENGTVRFREGGWSWGDWGENIDMELITNEFYYLALMGAANIAEALNFIDDASGYRQLMEGIKKALNAYFWNGTAYRHPEYKGVTDDRCQALAVVAGIAEKEKYPALLEIFKTEEHASPYMEKYVLEALFKMGYVDFAVERMKNRYGNMVNHPDYTTLFEGWGIGEKGYGGGTTNHSWSGGPLTILSQFLCGIEPIDPGYKSFQIIPNPGSVKHASTSIQSVKGEIKSHFENSNHIFKLTVTIPKGSQAIIGIPTEKVSAIKLNNKVIWKNGSDIENKVILIYYGIRNGHILFRVPEGVHCFEALRN